MKEHQKALQLRIMAAHLRHDADEWDRLARQSRYAFVYFSVHCCFVLTLFTLLRELGYNQQALYCYRKVYSLDPNNVDALWDRASLAKETGDLKTVRSIPFFSFQTNNNPRPVQPTSGSSNASHTTSQSSLSFVSSSSSSLIYLPAPPSSNPHSPTINRPIPPELGWTPPRTHLPRYKGAGLG